MGARKVLLVVLGALFALVSLGFVVGGGAALWAHGTQRDDEGYYQSSPERFSSDGFALVTRPVDLGAIDWLPFGDLGTLRLRVQDTAGGDVFVGVARATDVDRYLAGVPHDQIRELPYGQMSLRTRPVNELGRATPAAPAAQDFWVASATGPGQQTLTWDMTGGSWAVAVMGADGARNVTVDASAGIHTGWLLPIGLVLLGVALALGAAAVALLVAGLRGPVVPLAAEQGAPGEQPVPAGASAVAAYPARLDGQLDPALSRWLWLVKWLLAIPHYVVLAFLWIAFGVLTFAAGVAILFTGRYPRRIFAFNVGVVRWTWRVTFYAFVLGSDRYPPFTLAPVADYPAHFDVDYPERLSRSLVLVKWWLLALPHYVIVGIFGGGAVWWGWDSGPGDPGRAVVGVGLVGVLALVAAVALLFRHRYPLPVFEFVMGMERWTYRVLAYASLMRDDYPPFRLDGGGTDPGPAPGIGTGPPPAAPEAAPVLPVDQIIPA